MLLHQDAYFAFKENMHNVSKYVHVNEALDIKRPITASNI